MTSNWTAGHRAACRQQAQALSEALAHGDNDRDWAILANGCAELLPAAVNEIERLTAQLAAADALAAAVRALPIELSIMPEALGFDGIDLPDAARNALFELYAVLEDYDAASVSR